MSYRILYVDDDPDMREIAVLSLELNPSFEARTCGSGQEAIGVAATWRPDLIMLDVVMPGMDGPATLAALRNDPATSTITVVFITARAQPHDVARFLAMGAAGVIAKPFNPTTLASSVKPYLDR